MEQVSFLLSLTFILTILLSVHLFYRSTNASNAFLKISLIWLVAQTFMGIAGFYKASYSFPPRIALLAPPPLLFIIWLFVSARGRQFLDQLDLKALTLFHTIRIPVEIVLFWLFTSKAVPEIMTFEGRNLDILSGLSAPFIYYFGFVQSKLSKRVVLIWNFICLGLLLNVVFYAVLSVPTPFQQFGFEQPNVAVLYYPFLLLPAYLVPLVLLAHLAAIRRLTSNRTSA